MPVWVNNCRAVVADTVAPSRGSRYRQRRRRLDPCPGRAPCGNGPSFGHGRPFEHSQVDRVGIGVTHGQGSAADVARQPQRDVEVVFAELIKDPKGGADLRDTLVVAAEGEKRISTSLISALAYSAARSMPSGPERWSRP
jgi:hypothetical protein